MALKRIVHIMPDDKFIDDFIRMSESYAEARCSYLVLQRAETKFVKTRSEAIHFIRVDKHYRIELELVEQLNRSRVVVLHSFDSKYWGFVRLLSESINVVWIFWGIDGYNAIPKSKYVSRDSVSLQFNKGGIGVLKLYVRSILNRVVLNKQVLNRRIIKRANYCASFVQDDIELARSINPNIKELYFSYFNIEGYNLYDLDVGKTEEAILLGNSANPSNEHAAALKALFNANYNGKIYCPLSYSGSAVYVENLVEYGRLLFGNKFIPITKFLSYDKYSDMISRCDIVYMNHIRQQAVGNIVKSICSLKPIILNERSYLRSTFLEWGIKIYDLDILVNRALVEHKDLMKNREIVLNNFKEEKNRVFFDTISRLSMENNNFELKR